jgi:hypothetical protein
MKWRHPRGMKRSERAFVNNPVRNAGFIFEFGESQ